MALRMGSLYDALRLAQGVSEDDARKAAEEVANYENRIARVEARLDTLTWMVGTNIGLTLLVIGLILRLVGKA
jgi:phage shock protein A